MQASSTNNSAEVVRMPKDEAFCLLKIKEQMDYIGELFDSLSQETQDQFLKLHNEHHSLNHCLRWGRQAANELAECVSIKG